MAENHLKFLKYFLDKYSRIYDDWDIDLISDIIEETLLKAPAVFFTYDLVQENQDLCKQCGLCCKSMNVQCEYFDGKRCKEHATRPGYCREFPVRDIYDEQNLVLDYGCHFALNLADDVLRERFEFYEVDDE